MERDELTSRQCFFLLFLFLLGNLVTAAGAKGTQSGWLMFLVLGFLSIPVYWLFHKAIANLPNGDVFTNALGPLFGGVLTVAYGILAVLMAGDAMRLFADFIVINDLNDAGAWGNTAMLTLVVLMMLRCSLRSLGKAAWAVMTCAVVLSLFSVAVTLGKIDLYRLLPLLDEGKTLISRSFISSFATLLAASFYPIAVFGSGCGHQKSAAVYAAGITACLLMAVLSLRDAAVLGWPAIGRFRFPMFAAAATVRHSQILISSVFVLVQPFRAALCLRYTQACLEYRMPRFRRWYPPMLLGGAVLCGTLSWSSEQVRWRTAGELAVTVLLITGPVAAIFARRFKEKRTKT